MGIKFKRKLLLAKIEPVYGQDSAPTGAANAILVSNLDITPLEGQTEARDLSDRLGASEVIHTGQTVSVEFDVEMAGSGVIDTPVAYGPLLRGCGLAEVITATTQVAYSQVETGEEALTIYFHMQGQKHPLLGARGSVSAKIKSPGRPVWHFKLMGMWGAPSAVADPVPTYTAFKRPLPVNNANTTVTLDGAAVRLAELNLDQNAALTYRNLAGGEEVAITGREWKGSLTIEAPSVAAKDWFGVVKGDALVPLSFTHGTVAGQRVTIDAPRVQLTNPKFSDGDGLAMLQMDVTLIESSAHNDEISIVTH